VPNQKAKTAIEFLRAAVAFYAGHGISIRRLVPDNGHCFRSHRFHTPVKSLASAIATRLYTRRINGRTERFIQTALREWVRHCTNFEERD
jgi:hypothetical protein